MAADRDPDVRAVVHHGPPRGRAIQAVVYDGEPYTAALEALDTALTAWAADNGE